MTAASNEVCLDQLTCLSFTPSLCDKPVVNQVAAAFIGMAYTPSTHPFLTRPLLIRRLMEASNKSRNSSSNQDEKLMDRCVDS